ncbi:MAG: nickel-responsive transcriptional regulator NikR [Candidatus Hydrogenedentes bacterium]|nr:nickel-responsive transcriptional regulator NikR [Candidatus Hydrogenedentota bacterium]
MAECVERFGVSVGSDLLEKFDAAIARRQYPNRSEALRDLMRRFLIEEEWEQDDEVVVATITIIYDHHARTTSDMLMAYQHEHTGNVLSTLHIHLDHDNCLEVIVMRGRSGEIRPLADLLIGTKGVKYGKMTTASTGRDLPR